MKTKRINISIAAFLVILAFAAFSNAQKLTVRNAHSMVYDSEENKTYLFGGADEKQVYGDLWVLTQQGWDKIKTSKGPAPRTFATLVYDESRERIILFGGNSVLFGNDSNPGKTLSDTWEYKNGKWRELKPSNSPEARSAAGAVYDAAGKRVVLFGGFAMENGRGKRFPDTWEFRNNSWRKVTEEGPSARVGSAVAYNSSLKKIVLFGGSTEDKSYGEKTGETWVLKKDAWRKLDIVQPANIFDSNLVYEKSQNRFLRFGGWDGNGRINQTWMFNGHVWKIPDLEIAPAARNHASMVYDSRLDRSILFGGHNGEEIFGDLWIFKQGKWYKEFEHTPIKRINNGH